MKNRLSDLNNHLFAQLERLSDEDLLPEQIDIEARRSDALVGVADTIIRNAALQIQVAKIAADNGADPVPYLPAPNVTANRPIRQPDITLESGEAETTRGAARRQAELREATEWERAERRDLETQADETDLVAAAKLTFDLTPKEAQLLVQLMQGRVLSKEALYDALYSLDIEPPDLKIINVLLSTLRAKLGVRGIAIETVWGVGLKMVPAMIVRTREMLETSK